VPVELSLATLLDDRDRLQRTLDRLTDGATGISLPPSELVAMRWRLAMFDRLIARRETGAVRQAKES
jgi:hypothetical protein